MNKMRISLLLLVCTATSAYADQATGRSFFQSRLPWDNQHLLYADRIIDPQDKEGGSSFSFRAAAGYQASTNDGSFASYFLPNGKNNLVVKGANALGERDISAMWLQIVGENTRANPAAIFGADDPAHIFGTAANAEQWLNEYASVISLSPTFETTHATVHLRYQNVFLRVPWQLAVGLPVAQVRNALQLRETSIEHARASRNLVKGLKVKDDTTTDLLQLVQPQYSLSAIEAFNNPVKRYGKISDRTLEARGLGDVSLDLCVQVVPSVAFGVRGELPTAPKGTAEYLFEPLLGSNGHGTLGAYATFQDALWQGDNAALSLKAYAQYQAQLSGTELRTFDLVAAGAWSRYLLLLDYDNDKSNGVSGVNFLTRPVHVRTRSQATAGFAIQCEYKSFAFSAGYGAFAREKERLSVRGQLPPNLFIAGQLAPNDPANLDLARSDIYAGAKDTAISQNIAVFNNDFGNPDTNPDLALTNSDLDTQSASMPSYFSHQLNAMVGYTGIVGAHEVQVQLGASYETLRRAPHFDTYSFFGALTVKI